MSERLSPEVVAHVAQLARLNLTDDELALYTEQLAAVLDHAADVEALELDDVPPTLHPLSLVNVLRADDPRPGLDHDEVLAMAPSTEDGRFRVPRIMSEPAGQPDPTTRVPTSDTSGDQKWARPPQGDDPGGRP